MNINLFQMQDRFDHIVEYYLGEENEHGQYEEIFSSGEFKINDTFSEINSEFKIKGIKKLAFFQKIKENDRSKIQWAVDMQLMIENSMIDIEEFSPLVEVKRTMTPFGVFLIEVSGGRVYAVSFGYSSIFLSNYCNRDFGLDFAERVLSKQSVDVESLRYVNVNKKKSITVFSEDAVPNVTYGSADEYLKGRVEVANFSDTYDKALITKLLFYINSSFEFGASVKMVEAKQNRISRISSLEQLSEVIVLIDAFLSKNMSEAYKDRSIKLAIPRLKFVSSKDQLNESLDQLLVQAFETDTASVGIDFYSVIGADIIINEGSDVKLRHPGVSAVTIKDLTINDIKTYVYDANIGELKALIDGMKVEFENGSERSLKKCLIADVTYDNKTYVLVDGKWATYNDTFIEHINREIAKIIDEDIIEVKGAPYSISDHELAEYYNDNPQDFDRKYREYVYNTLIADKEGMKLLDTRNNLIKKYPNVEVMDLLNVNEIIHVKIGDPGKFIENIEQSMLASQVMSEEESKDDLVAVGIMSERLVPDFIVAQLFVLKDGDANQFNLLQSKSIKFKASLVEWYQTVVALNLQPKIYLASLESCGKFESLLQSVSVS